MAKNTVYTNALTIAAVGLLSTQVQAQGSFGAQRADFVQFTPGETGTGAGDWVPPSHVEGSLQGKLMDEMGRAKYDLEGFLTTVIYVDQAGMSSILPGDDGGQHGFIYGEIYRALEPLPPGSLAPVQVRDAIAQFEGTWRELASGQGEIFALILQAADGGGMKTAGLFSGTFDAQAVLESMASDGPAIGLIRAQPIVQDMPPPGVPDDDGPVAKKAGKKKSISLSLNGDQSVEESNVQVGGLDGMDLSPRQPDRGISFTAQNAGSHAAAGLSGANDDTSGPGDDGGGIQVIGLRDLVPVDQGGDYPGYVAKKAGNLSGMSFGSNNNSSEDVQLGGLDGLDLVPRTDGGSGLSYTAKKAGNLWGAGLGAADDSGPSDTEPTSVNVGGHTGFGLSDDSSSDSSPTRVRVGDLTGMGLNDDGGANDGPDLPGGSFQIRWKIFN